MEILTVGQPVPFPPFEGVRISLFTQGNNILFIGLDTPSLSELKAFSDNSCKPKMAVIGYENCLVLYFKIGTFGWQECTFNPALIATKYLDFNAVDDDKHYTLLNTVLFDSRSGRIEAMRSFTLNKKAQSIIQCEVKEMLKKPSFSSEAFNQSYQDLIKAGNVDAVLAKYQPIIYECGTQ